MELVEEQDNLPKPLKGFLDLPMVRQIGLMIATAASISMVALAMLWQSQPSQAVLFGQLDSEEATAIIEVLNQINVPYTMDNVSGAISVPADKIHSLRLRMAREGLPKSSARGLDFLADDPKFGTSQFLEGARYQHALEEELVATISSLNSIEMARVHLAIPKQSVFVRNRKKPTASVTLKMHSGRSIEQGQIDAISYMVSSSIPELEPERVTIVDHKGTLLSKKKSRSALDVSSEQLQYTNRIEELYRERIINIMTPIVGAEKVRAQVTAELDFTVTEQTMERFNPDLPALRSEQVSEEIRGGNGPVGIPGALSNQPPGAGNAPEIAQGPGATQEVDSAQNRSRHSTSNYELDRTISHVKNPVGEVRRLSIAIVLNHRQERDSDGNVKQVPRSTDELQQLRELIKQAIGYSVQRGDTINITNALFESEESFEIPEVPLWEKGWFVDLVKTGVAALLVIIFFLTVLRPMLKTLAHGNARVGVRVVSADGSVGILESDGTIRGSLESGSATLSTAAAGGDNSGQLEDGLIHIPTPGAYEENIKMVNKLVADDPALVAQVVKNWINDED